MFTFCGQTKHLNEPILVTVLRIDFEVNFDHKPSDVWFVDVLWCFVLTACWLLVDGSVDRHSMHTVLLRLTPSWIRRLGQIGDSFPENHGWVSVDTSIFKSKDPEIAQINDTPKLEGWPFFGLSLIGLANNVWCKTNHVRCLSLVYFFWLLPVRDIGWMHFMNSMQTSNSVTFYFMKDSFSDVSRKWILLNLIKALSCFIFS